jgi:hypothetical protein
LGADLGMLGGRQGRQVNSQPEPPINDGLAHGATFTTNEGLAALAQLAHMERGEGVQGARQGRLGRTLRASPGLRQGTIGAQARVDARWRDSPPGC